MKFKFWGVRGSIPAPGPQTVRYGGNTTCIEVRTDRDAVLVLDCGTGIFPLGQSLSPEELVEVHVLITHSHWDHINGLPMFEPLFDSRTRCHVYGAAAEGLGKRGIDHVFDVQFQNTYFPITEAQLSASIDFRTLSAGEAFMIEDARVEAVLMNHPVTNFGYRIDCGGKSLFFTGDHEPYANGYAVDDPQYPERQAWIDQRSAAIVAVLKDVDALIVDCTYTQSEYPQKTGWGHGTFDSALALAKRVGARHLYCTHHLPSRSDDELEAVFTAFLADHAGQIQGLAISLAYEGLNVTL
jgi:glyoxylase-like metal-dependent hydrolase (beta-lactamase superfamily II)